MTDDIREIARAFNWNSRKSPTRKLSQGGTLYYRFVVSRIEIKAHRFYVPFLMDTWLFILTGNPSERITSVEVNRDGQVDFGVEFSDRLLLVAAKALFVLGVDITSMSEYLNITAHQKLEWTLEFQNRLEAKR